MSGAAQQPNVDPGATVAAAAVLAPGVIIGAGTVVHPGATIGARTVIGCNSVVHDGVILGEDCTIEDCVVLGKAPRLRMGSSAAGKPPPGPLRIAGEVTVCSGAVVYAGAEIQAGAIIGDQAQIRERSTVGERSVVGRASCVDFEASVGARVLIQTGVYVTAGTIVEDDVFIGPGVTTTNDNAMGRHPKGEPLKGPVLRRACRIGGGVVLTPAVEVGEEAFVAAGSVVVEDVPARAVVMGVPARAVRSVPDEDLIERWRSAERPRVSGEGA
jgi:UDP-3-O-[3-hydroxymyristoyl] glucosamine N-acyltransferase